MPVVNMTIDLVPTIRQIPIASLRLDGGTQIRQARSEETIADYAEKMRAGEVFPPVTAYYDGAEYWLADGFQRVMARGLAGASTIDVDVRPGTQRDAVLFACGANAEHGSRRTNADKRRAVEVAISVLVDESPTAEEIAKVCKVPESLIVQIRKEFKAAGKALPPVKKGNGVLQRPDGEAEKVVIANPDLSGAELSRRTGLPETTISQVRRRLKGKPAAEPTPAPRKSPIEGLLSTIVAVHVGWEGYAERFAELWPKATDEDRAELITRLSECRRQASKFIHTLEKM